MRALGIPLKPLAILIPYLWPRHRFDLRLRVVSSLICLILASGAAAIAPLMLAAATDSLSGANIFFASSNSALKWIAVYVAALILAQGFAQMRDLFLASVVLYAARDIARRAFAHLLALSPRFHASRETGSVLRTIERGRSATGTLLTYATFNTVPILLQIAIFAGEILWKIGAGALAIALVTIAAYVWFTAVLTRRQAELRRAVNERDNAAGAKMMDSLLNYETVKCFGAEAHERERFGGEMARFARTMTDAEISIALLNCGQAAIMAIGMGALMALTALGIRNGVYTLGAFVLGNAILVQLYQPLTVLGTVYHEIVQGLVDMEAFAALLGRKPDIADAPDAADLVTSHGAIEFQDVVFAYEEGRTVLTGVSFRVPAGKTVAIVGPSGAGKSTIARIQLRFHDIAGGRVTIDGQDIASVTQASLRDAIGVVPQEAGLFNDTIAYNIAYGRLDATQAEIETAAGVAQIDRFIRSLPDGYDTEVGERGLKLSGGERQRLAIARAILKDPPILLLDEATSALDIHSERAVQDAIAAAGRGRTTLIIAHRLSTVVDADEILVLAHGKIAERGTHTALLAQGGQYAALWRKQQEAEAVRETIAANEDMLPPRDGTAL